MQLASRVSLHQSKLRRNLIGISYRQGNGTKGACVPGFVPSLHGSRHSPSHRSPCKSTVSSHGPTSFRVACFSSTPCEGGQLADETGSSGPSRLDNIGIKKSGIRECKSTGDK